MSRIGLRPCLSDNRPQIGENTNCIAENEAMMMPMVSPSAPNWWLYTGTSGTTIPKPIRSMNTVRKMTRSEGFLMREDPAGHKT